MSWALLRLFTDNTAAMRYDPC
jgi:hypothetical protein